jgi:hypothetical protein
MGCGVRTAVETLAAAGAALDRGVLCRGRAADGAGEGLGHG